MSDDVGPQNKIILYQAENGKVRLEVEFDGDTVWLSQALMADLYQTTPQNITQHIREIYRDGECAQEATCKESLQVRLEGARKVKRSIKLYNLTMTMAAWIAKLDDFLRLSDREILTHAGAISHDAMRGTMDRAYERYQALTRDEPTRVEKDMQELEKRVKIPRRNK